MRRVLESSSQIPQNQQQLQWRISDENESPPALIAQKRPSVIISNYKNATNESGKYPCMQDLESSTFSTTSTPSRSLTPNSDTSPSTSLSTDGSGAKGQCSPADSDRSKKAHDAGLLESVQENIAPSPASALESTDKMSQQEAFQHV
ncbi:hypothetical protein AOLI_G00200480 [Acnodon oligacanthus]